VGEEHVYCIRSFWFCFRAVENFWTPHSSHMWCQNVSTLQTNIITRKHFVSSRILNAEFIVQHMKSLYTLIFDLYSSECWAV
jgi:hypothetical protein